MQPTPHTRVRTGTHTGARTRRRGFSLLELMLVLAILGILMTVVVVNVAGGGERAKITATRSTLTTIKQQLASYHLEQSAYPDQLSVLQTSKPPYLDASIPLEDAWKRPLTYFATGATPERPYTLISSGADGELGTEDDIDVWTMNTGT